MSRREYVCKKCVDEPYLWKAASADLCSKTCDYCGRTSKNFIACDKSEVICSLRSAIEREYHDPANELPYDEGEYIGTWYAGAEVLDDIGYYPGSDLLMNDITDAIVDESYCQIDYFGSTSGEVFELAWGRFCEMVKTKRRYTFWTSDDQGEFQDPSYGITAPKLLSMIGGNISFLSLETTIPVGTRIWRARVFDRGSPHITDPKQYTSPPVDKATQANRMSPAGISMFYGSADFVTAYKEIVDPGKMTGKVVRGAKFATVHPLNLLDLTNVPTPGSYFDESWDSSKRDASKFLRAFAESLSRPIRRDHRQHIEYVPTQVFTEYVRYEMKTDAGARFHGIKYRSSINRKNCYVIFADQDDCFQGSKNRPQLLAFVPASIRKRQQKKTR